MSFIRSTDVCSLIPGINYYFELPVLLDISHFRMPTSFYNIHIERRNNHHTNHLCCWLNVGLLLQWWIQHQRYGDHCVPTTIVYMVARQQPANLLLRFECSLVTFWRYDGHVLFVNNCLRFRNVLFCFCLWWTVWLSQTKPSKNLFLSICWNILVFFYI